MGCVTDGLSGLSNVLLKEQKLSPGALGNSLLLSAKETQKRHIKRYLFYIANVIWLQRQVCDVRLTGRFCVFPNVFTGKT